MARAKLYDLARVTTTTVGTGTINLGSAVPGALTFDDAGVQDGDVVSYGIKDSTASEVGRGTYSSTGPTLARTTVLKSTNGGSALNLTGNNAEVFITALAEDFDFTANLSGGFWTASDVASAATCDIGGATTPYVRITGTTTITSLGTQPSRFRFVEFTGSLTLTYNATSLILPGTANIITKTGDKGIFVSDASGNWKCVCWTPVSFLPREKLTANRTYYVRPDGSDNNNGLANTSGGAFLTLQKACDVVYGTLDLGGFDVTIQVAAASTPATFTAGVAITSPQVGKGTITLQGDTTTPANFVISTSGDCIAVVGAGTVLNVRGFKLTSSGANCLNANTGGRINFGKIDFGAATTQTHIRYTNAGSVGLISGDDYKISGSAGNHMLGLSNGLAAIASITVTITGTPAWGTAFINLQGAQASLFNLTYSGSSTGARYAVAGNGLLNSFGAGTASTYFPGNSNGTTASGGQQI